MPISMVDYSHLIKEPMSLGLYKNLMRMGDVVKLFPVVEVGSLVVRGTRWDTLPSHGFRKLNAGFSQSTGTTNVEEDRLAIFGGEFQSDKVLKKLKTPLLRDPVQVQFDMHSLAMERGVAYQVFMGDVDTTPDGFDGILARLDDGRIAARNWMDCSDLNSLASQANAKLFIDYVETLLKYVGLSTLGVGEGGMPRGALFTNEAGLLGIQRVFRLADYQASTFDYLGKRWRRWPDTDIPIIDVGYQRDKVTEIIPSDLGAGGDHTYLFAVRFSEPDGDIDSPGSDGMTLVQTGAMEIIGPEPHNLYELWNPQWVLGLSHVGDDYCAGGMYNFTFSAS